jgi:hypothetical protein
MSERAHLTTTLKEFWRRARTAQGVVEKLDLLREFAERQVVRKRTALDVRKEKGFVMKSALCWCCAAKAQVLHHIVQVQHGGGTGDDARVPLCKGCHAVVHPWLRETT